MNEPQLQPRMGRPSLIVRDLCEAAGLSPDATFRILADRGTLRTFALRRNLLEVQRVLTEQETERRLDIGDIKPLVQEEPNRPSLAHAIGYARGYHRALQDVRRRLRRIIETPQQYQDNDPTTNRWLRANPQPDLWRKRSLQRRLERLRLERDTLMRFLGGGGGDAAKIESYQRRLARVTQRIVLAEQIQAKAKRPALTP